MPTLSELREERMKKTKKIKDAGIDPYPASSNRSSFIRDFLSRFELLLPSRDNIILAGRIKSIRSHGKLTFCDIEDETGRIQLLFSREQTENYEFFLEILDEGDIIEAKGEPYLSKRGEKSLQVISIRILTKTIQPFPKEWFGLKNAEECYRKRYLDLLFNSGVKERFVKAARILKELRLYLDANGFLEVTTPILQPLAGGALAKPFITHFNALDEDVYLRIAPELYLKRLLVGGFEKVYELGTVFRNEGMDRDHNPEFLMLEAYWAYQDWEGLMKFTEQWFFKVATAVDFFLPSPPWKRKEFEELLKEYTGIIYEKADEKELRDYAKKKKILIGRALSKGKIADELFKKIVRPTLQHPTFITKLPLDISPFAKQLENDKTRTARFILYINGLELANAFSELNDPVEQEERFQSQQDMKKRGDEEITEYDKDFIETLEYGMPPAAGLGLGVTRFIMLLTGASSARDATLFPMMKTKS